MNVEEKDCYVKKIVIYYKLFEREFYVSKYFIEYWYEKLKDLLLMIFYNEEIDNFLKVGNEFCVFCWDFFIYFLVEILLIFLGLNLWIFRVVIIFCYIIYIFRYEMYLEVEKVF